VRALAAGFRIQLRFYRAYPDNLIPLFTSPLFTIIFLMIVRHGGRSDLSAYAIVAPIFIALWWFALFHGGWVIQTERWEGTIEQLVASPSGLPLVVFGRILAVTTVGLVAFPEIWLISRYVLHTHLTVHHPSLLVATLIATAFAMAATALFMAALFVLARNAVTFSNSASYPFYVLGGILVPVSFLPGWIQPLTKIVFLSWASDLLRSSLAPGRPNDPVFRVGMVVALGIAALALAGVTLRGILRRVRTTGELGFQ
jgi:ABC-2 type transport system permease protein